MTIPEFQKHIMTWYQTNGRHNLPWRQTTNPYHILVSEIMLQQTQVSRVIPKYHLFLKNFPTTKDLASAKQVQLLEIWSGLGYWRRAKFLQATAQKIESDYQGMFPKDPQELQKLPGIGPYTAGATSCFAFNTPVAFVDTNIRRVYLHHFFADQTDISDKDILSIANQTLQNQDPRTWHWALFDYGATEIKQSKANQRSRHYTKQSPFKGSFRSYRAFVLKTILAQPDHQIPQDTLKDLLQDKLRQDEQDHDPDQIITALLKDKLLHQTRKTFFLQK